MKILHVITTLDRGGAERSLCHLAGSLSQRGVQSAVICLAARGALSEELESRGVEVHHLGIQAKGGWGPKSLALRALAGKLAPDLVQGWMYHGNLAASFAMLGRTSPVIWGIRTSIHRPELLKRGTRIVMRLGALGSRRSARVVYNSLRSREQHEQAGYCRKKGLWIPNGIDVADFVVDPSERASMRQRLGFAPEHRVCVSVGRLNVVKGYEVLLDAIAGLGTAAPQLRFLIVGRQVDWNQQPFLRYCHHEGVRERVRLLPQTDRVQEVYAAADALISPSLVEAFPNVLVEGMASGLPCIATDVGDVRAILGGRGRVMPAGDVAALTDALLVLDRRSQAELEAEGAECTQRVADEYSIEKNVSSYLELYYSVLAGRGTE